MRIEIKPRKEHVENARARWTLLLAATKKPSEAPASLKAACQTQQDFAEFKFDKEKISPLALNTLKLSAEAAVVPGGWREMDRLRKECRNLFAADVREKEAKRLSPAAGLRRRNEELKTSQTEFLRGHAITLRAYQDLLDTLRGISAENTKVYEKLQEHEAIYNIRLLYPVVETFTRTLPAADADAGDEKVRSHYEKSSGT